MIHAKEWHYKILKLQSLEQSKIQSLNKKHIVNFISKKVPNVKIKYKKGNVDPWNYRVDFSKIEKYLNFKSKYTVSDGIEELIRNFHLFKKKNKKLFGNYKIEK